MMLRERLERQDGKTTLAKGKAMRLIEMADRSRRRGILHLLTSLVLLLAGSPLLASGAVRSFDARTATLAQVAGAARSSQPGALFRIAGLRSDGGETLTLALEAASIFAPGFRLFVDGRELGRDAVARPSFLRGTVVEWPGSSVALTLDGATGSWHGYVVTGDRVYEISLPAGAAEKSLADAAVIRESAPEPLPGDWIADGLEPPPGIGKSPRQAPFKVVVAPGAEYEAAVAVETDHELFQGFGTVEAATSYVAARIGDSSELYFRQLGISLSLASLSLYTTPDDPWNAPNPHSGATADVLCEFASFWQRFRPVKSFPRDAAVFFTGKESHDIGGQAWLRSLCNFSARPTACPFGAYGIVVRGRPLNDNLIVAHELGHTFGSHHTHCYSPPIDQCHTGERGCHAGAVSAPEDGGSVMSYCASRNFSLGEPGRFGLDSQRVVEVLRSFAASVAPACLERTNDPYALAGEAAPGSVTLSWLDLFSTESKWLVEQRLPNGKFKQVRALPASASGVTLTRIKRGPQTFRVRARFKSDFSDYSNAVTVQVP
jgi:hypothetical protein